MKQQEVCTATLAELASVNIDTFLHLKYHIIGISKLTELHKDVFVGRDGFVKVVLS